MKDSIMEIRTTCPCNYNPYYMTTDKGGYSWAIKGKPTKADANVLSNCVGYANGRYAEIQGTDGIKYQLVCNAENFIDKAKSYGLSISSAPSLGGIMVWEGKGSLAGHVAIVERIDSNNQIFTSESAYGGSAFYNKTRTNDNGNWSMNSNYKYLGCIVNSVIPPTPVPPTPTGTIGYIQQTLNERYGYNLAVDNVAGYDTWKHLRMALQHELNVQFGAGLVEDGILGTKSQKALSRITVRYGAQGNITWLIQACLNIKGYNTNGIDGLFYQGTKNAVGSFQRNNGLSVDYIVGKNTFEKLFK